MVGVDPPHDIRRLRAGVVVRPGGVMHDDEGGVDVFGSPASARSAGSPLTPSDDRHGEAVRGGRSREDLLEGGVDGHPSGDGAARGRPGGRRVAPVVRLGSGPARRKGVGGRGLVRLGEDLLQLLVLAGGDRGLIEAGGVRRRRLDLIGREHFTALGVGGDELDGQVRRQLARTAHEHLNAVGARGDEGIGAEGRALAVASARFIRLEKIPVAPDRVLAHSNEHGSRRGLAHASSPGQSRHHVGINRERFGQEPCAFTGIKAVFRPPQARARHGLGAPADADFHWDQGAFADLGRFALSIGQPDGLNRLRRLRIGGLIAPGGRGCAECERGDQDRPD